MEGLLKLFGNGKEPPDLPDDFPRHDIFQMPDGSRIVREDPYLNNPGLAAGRTYR